ncbi:MAG TPA: sialidase family protein, partial [Candidatus Sumerlaeota bacterium]|nr:sialidase family protein [Candidatus Sumerlaeota bacterium]
AGHQGDRQWSYGAGTLGLGVASNDSTHVAFTDLGFCHLSTDGGANWTQTYVNPADENPAGAATPKGKAYHSNGLEVTSNWALAWFDANNMWASFSDIQGTRSTDGGATWSFNYTGHTLNTSYKVVVHPTTGVGYMAASNTHDVYETTYLTDGALNGGTGVVRFSTDDGATWQVMRNFGHIVYDVALDPTATDRLYAAVVHSGADGGIWVTNNASAGASSTWTQLTDPPRTEGHPYCIRVLNDGTIVATFSGRRTSSFTQSSGVFVSTDGGSTWADRSHANMTYYVKDLVVDPHDVAQNTWYVGVWSGYGGPFATNNEAGGLYRTTNRGVSWSRIQQVHRVTSCAVSPTNANELFFTTESEGLWYTSNLGSPTPTFEQITSYPFGTPYRVYYDPFVSGRIWVTSFGHGTKIGTISAPSSVTAWVALGGM